MIVTPCWWECKMVLPLQKTVQPFLKRLNPYLLYDFAIPLIGTDSRERKIHYPYKDLFMNIHSSFIGNSPKLDITQMPINRSMNKQSAMHPFNGVPLSLKMTKSLIYTTWMQLKISMLSERNQIRRVHFT